jgi:hypothetical protein
LYANPALLLFNTVRRTTKPSFLQFFDTFAGFFLLLAAREISKFAKQYGLKSKNRFI